MRFLMEDDTIEHTLTKQPYIDNKDEKEIINYIHKGGNIPRVYILNPQDKTLECYVRLNNVECFSKRKSSSTNSR